jgi:hypothetical protein
MSGEAAFKEHAARPWPLSFRRADRLCRDPFRGRTGRIPLLGSAALLLRRDLFIDRRAEGGAGLRGCDVLSPMRRAVLGGATFPWNSAIPASA